MATLAWSIREDAAAYAWFAEKIGASCYRHQGAVSDVRNIEFAQFGATNVHPLAVGFLACASALVFSRKRSAATLAILAVCVFMPADQRIVIGGLDFSMLRLVAIVALIRIFIRGEYRGLSFGKVDLYFVLFVFSASFFHVLRVGPSGIVFRLGTSFDALTAFFLIRVFVRSRVDVLILWRQVAWIVLVLSPFMIYEAVTEHNAFGMFRYGGWDQAIIRDGRVRATGPFSHPILAGTFGGTVTPVFMAIFFGRKKERRLFGAAGVGATIVTLTAASSGAVVAWGIGLLGWGMWRIRGHMRSILWTGVGMAVVIHFVREKPVWHLISRLSALIGGAGNHRYRLIDAFLRRFNEWALVGTDDTASWGWGMQDTTSYYVSVGKGGGLVTLLLFIMVLRTSFVQLRLSRIAAERLQGPRGLWALLAWGCSVSLAAHCVSFISVKYFGQMQILFFFFVATIPALTRFKRPKRVKAPAARLSTSTPIADGRATR